VGLSDEERISGIFYAIDRMVELVKNLDREKNEYSYPKKLISYIDLLWHAFIGNHHNSAHWILGSSANQEVTHYSNSIWGTAAINYHTDRLLKENDSIIKESDTFDAFDGFLDISSLLRCESPIYSFIYNIYSWTEQVIYYLRRYEDKLLKDHEELSKIISDIQGECFHLFKENDVYARAYILNKVCKLIYTNKYPHDSKHYDAFTRFLVNHHEQHDLNRPMFDHDIKALAEIHATLHRAEKAKKLTVMMRVEAFMVIAGRKFHYDHKFNELVKVLKLTKLDLIKLKILFLKCKEDHDVTDKRSHEQFVSGQGSPLSIYGYDVE
jgi:hypothetical protein